MNTSGKRILLVLGSPNSPEGLLSPMAISRLDTCFRLYRREGGLILLTGGYGPHFNTSGKPHHWYARQYLAGKGVPAAHLLEGVDSSHTGEDATMSLPVVLSYAPSRVTVITSDYHLHRAGIVFCNTYGGAVPLRFAAAPSCELTLAELQALLAHETAALKRLSTHPVTPSQH